MKTKSCSLCKEEKSVVEFGALAHMKDGLHSSCKACINAYNRAKRDAVSPFRKERERDRLAQYRADHPEATKAARIKADVKYRRSPKGKENRARRQARERASKVGTPPLSLADVLARDGLVCHICTKAVEDARLVAYDHVIPLARGGEHTLENIKVAHRSCNAWKGDRLMDELVGAPLPAVDPWQERVDARRRQAQSEASIAAWVRDRDTRVAAMSNPSPEVRKRRSDGNKAAWAAKTPEERKEQGVRAYATRTPEQLAARAAKVAAAWANKTPEEKAAHAAKISATKKARGSKGNVENLAKGWAPEVRAKAIEKSAEMRRGVPLSAETRAKMSAGQKAGWTEQRRLNASRPLRPPLAVTVNLIGARPDAPSSRGGVRWHTLQN